MFSTILSSSSLLNIVCFIIILLSSNGGDGIIYVNGQQQQDSAEDNNMLGDNMDLSVEQCQMFAQQGMCDMPQLHDIMKTKCLEECQEWKRTSMVEPEMLTATIDDPDEFYDLKAKKFGDDNKAVVVEFERFEGYMTLIINMALVCDPNHFNIEEPLKQIEHLHDVWPYNLEIVFFPYKVVEPNYYKNRDCTHDKSIISQFATNSKVHIMEEVKLNGSQTHPVYKFLKSTFNKDKLDLKHASYYFISPDANKAVMYHAIDYKTLKKFVSKEMQNLQYIADKEL